MSRSGNFVAAGLFAIIAVLTGASAAFAHDQLVSSSPAADERLDAAPERVTLEYSAEILALEGAGTTVMVVDGKGRDWTAGTPTVERNIVTAELAPGMPDAGYEVRWQVVSSDGHPISGMIPFTVGDGEPLQIDVSSAAIDGSDETTQTATEPQSAGHIPRPVRVALVGVSGAAIAVAGHTTIRYLRRRHDGGTGESTE